MKHKSMLTAQEVAVMTGVSVQSLNRWYKWKQLNPEHELAKLIPDFVKTGGERSARYWTPESVYQLIEFRSKLPHGRNGILGDVTQKYYRKDRDRRIKNVNSN